ncbi:hypothetical protein SCLCIDRAFT_909086 [Scleroderma citrinum Foug A]|uniref:Uncharacterized protein n=1 Tax=Scleroderma citrinum Foug A TaxID=1036808 RepID=A0A0C3DKI7_9AGAM|nr:hypothetical protein SCLCIDRAFT_909086 [Scleroderma citrinum Foug A]
MPGTVSWRIDTYCEDPSFLLAMEISYSSVERYEQNVPAEPTLCMPRGEAEACSLRGN